MSIRQIISVELQAVDHKNMQVVQNFIRGSNFLSNKPLNTCQNETMFVVTTIGICEIADVDTLILLIHFWNFKDRVTYLF